MGEAANKIDAASLQRLLSLVKTHTGITMQERKREMLYARVSRRLRVLGMETIEQYMDHLGSKSPETQEFVNLVTTNMTQFFRTQPVWDYFQKEFLPEWHRANPGAVLKVWSAAASTGEEALSIAMSCEDFKAGHPSFNYRVYGTDISTEVLAVAQAATYNAKAMSELKTKFPGHIARFFRAVDGEKFKAGDLLTKNIEFAQHNLHAPAPRQGFYDIVFLRNVMIYFDDADNEHVLRRMHAAMKPNAILVLGESESLSRLKKDFVFVKPLIYVRSPK